jgi:hypothetical protein
MRLTEPRLWKEFDHAVIDAKTDLDQPRVRPRGPGPPKLVRVKDAGRTWQALLGTLQDAI